jgi:hypothetical protein
MGKLFSEYLSKLTDKDFEQLEDNGETLRQADIDDVNFEEWRNIGLSPIDMFYDVDGSLLDEEHNVILEHNKAVGHYTFSSDKTALIIDGEPFAYTSYSEDNDTFYKLSDGRVFKNVTKDYV